MSHPGEIHLTGARAWEDQARTIFKTAQEKWREDNRSLSSSYAHVSDLAEKTFFVYLDGAIKKHGESVFLEHLPKEGPDLARFVINDTVIKWEEGKSKPRRKRSK